ncbi:hypothetical protein TWF788_004539 [Orbilia oligospora]|uniref:Hydrophobin n=1 Tax=Orbilia oligospora TaxID=2813651 RepID=A0A7C8K6R8_ORBOL|nr:hypothetical protein TWF788_004539 [Orbilia oligospora]
MQLLTIITISLGALASAAPQFGFGRPFPVPVRGGDNIANFPGGRIGGTGSAGSNAGSSLNNNGNNNGGNSAGPIVDSPNSSVTQSSTSCANGQIVCCNGPTTNTASSNSGRQSTRTLYPQYQYLLSDLFRSRVNIPTVNNQRESNESNQCNSVTNWESGSASPICQQTVACCSGNQGPAVANVGCTAMNTVVNTGNSPVKNNGNGFFPFAN